MGSRIKAFSVVRNGIELSFKQEEQRRNSKSETFRICYCELKNLIHWLGQDKVHDILNAHMNTQIDLWYLKEGEPITVERLQEALQFMSLRGESKKELENKMAEAITKGDIVESQRLLKKINEK